MAGSRPLLFRLALCAFLLTTLFGALHPPATLAAPALQNNPAVRIQITSLTFDDDERIYRMGLAIDRPDLLQRVIVQVVNEAGTNSIEEEINPQGQSTFVFEFAADRLDGPGKYVIRIRARGLTGAIVEREEDFGGSGDPSVLATQEFQLSADENTLNFTIESVNADYANDRLVISLSVQQPERVTSFNGFVVNSGGQRVADIPPTLFPNPPLLQLPLPDAMRNAGPDGEPQEFRVTINLTTRDNQSFQQVFEGFKPVPPPPPDMMTRIMESFSANPWVPLAIMFVISGAVVFIIMRNRRGEPELPAYRPPVDHTVNIPVVSAPDRRPVAGPGTPTPRRMRLRMRVIESPGMQPNTEQVVDEFPYVLGRGLWLSDPQMSREHATISMRSGQFYITDNKSRNGTTVRDLTLNPDQTVPLEGSTIVRLGLNTMLEIEPYG